VAAASDSVSGCVTVKLAVALQPCASVTLTEYRPAATPARSCVAGPSDQANVYGGVPPAGDSAIAPLGAPAQLAFVTTPGTASAAAGAATVKPAVAMQPCASVTVTA